MQCCHWSESCTAIVPTIELARQVWHHLLMLNPTELSYAFEPVFTDIKERSTVVDRFIDRNLYQVYIATLWSNVVLSPGEAGIEEEDLEELHDLVVAEIKAVLVKKKISPRYLALSAASGGTGHGGGQAKPDPQRLAAVLFQHDSRPRWPQKVDG